MLFGHLKGTGFRASSGASLLNIPPLAPIPTRASLDSGYHWSSLLCRRSRPGQATLRPATHRFANFTNPSEPFGRSTASTSSGSFPRSSHDFHVGDASVLSFAPQRQQEAGPPGIADRSGQPAALISGAMLASTRLISSSI